MDLTPSSSFAFASCNHVLPPTPAEYQPIGEQMWRLDWRDELTFARAARALRHLGDSGKHELRRWGSASDHADKYLRAFNRIDASKSDWRDLSTMLAAPGRGAKHVKQSLAELARRATETAASTPTAAASQQRMTLTRVDVLAKNPKPLAWAIKGVLLQDSLAAVIGQPGSGKSFLAIDMALHVAAGRPWNGRKTINGPVIYLAGEGQNGIARHVVASSIRHGIDLAGVPLYVSSCAALVDQKPEVDKVLAAADEIAGLSTSPPRLIVIDTLARSFSGRSENDASDMGNFIRGMDAIRERHGAAVLVIHHAGVSEGAEMRARGSSALNGALDVSMTLVNSKDGLRTLHVTKVKDFQEFQPMGFTLESVDLPAAWSDEDGMISTSAVIMPAAISSASEGMTDRQRAAYEVAAEICGAGERCEKKALARELQDRTIAKDRFAASRVIAELVDRGSLIADGRSWLIHCGRASECLGESFDNAA